MVRGTKTVEAEADPEEVAESPRVCRGVEKVIPSVKQFITGSQGPSIPKDGAPSIISSPNRINRVEVVITVCQKKKAIPEPIVVTSDASSLPPDSQMAPPSSATPLFFSVKSSESRKRRRDDQYEVYQLRRAFTASQDSGGTGTGLLPIRAIL